MCYFLQQKKIRLMILADTFVIMLQFYFHFIYLADFSEPGLKVRIYLSITSALSLSRLNYNYKLTARPIFSQLFVDNFGVGA